MAYTHGAKHSTDEQSTTYQVKDPFHVLHKIPDTAEYWRSKKFELISKLENFGPFQCFFSLSCADKRWEENFGALLHEVGVEVSYENDTLTKEIKTSVTVGGETLALEEYLTDRRYCDDSRHNMIRKNVLSATRIFDNRVKELMKHVIMSKENPMNVKIFNYRVEFQARGAAHIHGVLWVDFDQTFPNGINGEILKSVFQKFKNNENLEKQEELEAIKFIDTFVTCTQDKDEAKKLLIRESGDKDIIAAKAVEIASTVNQHRHNKT